MVSLCALAIGEPDTPLYGLYLIAEEWQVFIAPRAARGRISLFVRLLINSEAAGGRFGAWAVMKNTHI